jgi:hypothetical protein
MSNTLPAPATEDRKQQYTTSSQFTGFGQDEAVQTSGATLQQQEDEPKKGLGGSGATRPLAHSLAPQHPPLRL